MENTGIFGCSTPTSKELGCKRAAGKQTSKRVPLFPCSKPQRKGNSHTGWCENLQTWGPKKGFRRDLTFFWTRQPESKTPEIFWGPQRGQPHMRWFRNVCTKHRLTLGFPFFCTPPPLLDCRSGRRVAMSLRSERCIWGGSKGGSLEKKTPLCRVQKKEFF